MFCILLGRNVTFLKIRLAASRGRSTRVTSNSSKHQRIHDMAFGPTLRDESLTVAQDAAHVRDTDPTRSVDL